ncbi:interference hedgehog-like [Polymixia lowei]
MKTILLFVFVLGAESSEKVTQVKPGETAKLECGVSTTNKNLKWERESQLIFDINGRTGASRNGKTPTTEKSKVLGNALHISSVSATDAGRFTCTVDGTPHHQRLLVVSVSVTPPDVLRLGSKAMLNCKVEGLVPEPQVEWQRPGGQPGNPQVNAVARSDAGTWLCCYSYNGERYTMDLMVGVEEPAPPTQNVSTSLPPSPKDVNKKKKCHNCQPGDVGFLSMEAMGLKLWMWIVIGAGGLVLVLVVVLSIVLPMRKKRMRRKARKLKTLRLPLKANDYCRCERPAAAAAPPRGRPREKPSTLPRQ